MWDIRLRPDLVVECYPKGIDRTNWIDITKAQDTYAKHLDTVTGDIHDSEVYRRESRRHVFVSSAQKRALEEVYPPWLPPGWPRSFSMRLRERPPAGLQAGPAASGSSSQLRVHASSWDLPGPPPARHVPKPDL